MRAIQTFTAPQLSPRADFVLETIAKHSARNHGVPRRTLMAECQICQQSLMPILAALLEQGRIRAEDRGHAVYYWCGS